MADKSGIFAKLRLTPGQLRAQSLSHPERRRQVWDIAEAVVERDNLLNVEMILTRGLNDLPADA